MAQWPTQKHLCVCHIICPLWINFGLTLPLLCYQFLLNPDHNLAKYNVFKSHFLVFCILQILSQYSPTILLAKCLCSQLLRRVPFNCCMLTWTMPFFVKSLAYAHEGSSAQIFYVFFLFCFFCLNMGECAPGFLTSSEICLSSPVNYSLKVILLKVWFQAKIS